MTELLEKALERMQSLPEEEQDAIAGQILESLEDERAWADRFAASPDRIREMAERALASHERGETRPLDDVL